MARRAKEAGWEAGQTDAFRKGLLEHPEYLSLHAQREAAATLASESLARLVTAAASDTPAAVCSELPKARFANQRLRTVLEMEYEWLNRQIWDRKGP